MFADRIRKSRFVCSLNLIDFGDSFQEDERGHGGDRIFLSDFGNSVDITFQKVDGRVLLGQCLKRGRNRVTWSTPGCVEVNYG